MTYFKHLTDLVSECLAVEVESEAEIQKFKVAFSLWYSGDYNGVRQYQD